MPKRQPDTRRIGLLIAGWVFVVLGLAGLVLPFLQGVLFLLLGLWLLSLASPRARLLRQRLVVRYPAVGRLIAHARARGHEVKERALEGLSRLKRAVTGTPDRR